MADRTVAQLVVDRLRAWRVPRAFGCPGDAIAPVVEALGAAGGDPEFVPARHEETAAFMATGHARFTGGVGVCLAAQGPSAVHLLNGLYDAKLDSRPVVAIIGEDVCGPLGEVHEEIGLSRLFADVCHQFVRYGRTPAQVPALLDQAFRTAVATRSPTCVVLPRAVQVAVVADLQPHAAGVLTATPGEPLARVLPHRADLDAAAALLTVGRRVAILVGQGARGAAGPITALADRLGAGVATSLLGKPVLDERLPYHTGVLGEVGTPAAAELMGGADTLLLVGTNDPWTDYFPPPGQTRTIQIDIDGRRIGTRYPVDVPLVGDAAETVRALVGQVADRPNRQWRATVEGSVDRWRAAAAARAAEPAEPVNPQLVLHELSARLPRTGAVAVDVGAVLPWYARHLTLPPGVDAQLCGSLGSPGCALPYAFAAKLDRPDVPVVALLGDDAMQLTGLAELITVAQRWPEWADPRLVVLVLNDRDHHVPGGGPWLPPAAADRSRSGTVAVRRADVPYAGWARLLGLHGVRVDRPELVGAAWDEALAADRPCVLEAVVDPTVPRRVPEPALADLRDLVADGDAARRIRDRMMSAERSVVEAEDLV
ncbi:thiamine pyrophosphate-binding protein [Micromonospora sp. WMMD987]|uniref:thiamine pyrophosphate-binding protein n=1 Tax=Micromonospora TaxID=1873 RepID=UPI00249C4E10|nr:thiamine pyrophosphate-binding protein [Micromonospora sp. WMMD987]WFE93267.1 thiamine pyrophosphate-binding protein [Micromonospora sp. WMMD987]